MLDKKAYKLLTILYKKDRLTFGEIQSETHKEERESSSLCVSALCSEKFISTWESSESILTRLETTSNLAMKSHMLVALM